LLDKRAVHLGGGGTHRLGLWDAILVKNNHLALLANREEDAVRVAVERAWPARQSAAFIEVEVRSQAGAIAAAQAFRRVQESSQEGPDGNCPCLLLLDNMPPAQIASVIADLRTQNLLDHILTEASGNISESNLEEYAASGVDAISMGALTHSARALDLCESF
jgi:nicotinate-nucleotide pyrophosphorylase (carboxylating)